MGARQITVSGRLPEPYRQQFGSACGNHPQTAAKSIIASFARMSTDSDHVLVKKCDSPREKCVRFPARENCDTNVSAFHNFRNNCVYTLAKRRRSGIIFLKKEHPQKIVCGVAAPEGGNTGNAI